MPIDSDSDYESPEPSKKPDSRANRLACAAELQTLNPAVADFLKDDFYKCLFSDIILRQCNLIKSRSQIIADHQVTVYAGLLLELTKNGTELDDPMVQEFFCREYLGIAPDTDPAKVKEVIEQNIALKAVFLRGIPKPYTLCAYVTC